MKKIYVCILLLIFTIGAFVSCANKNIQGTYKVSTETDTLVDDTRNREVPIKVYFPKNPKTDEKFPVIIFSHGLGGSCEGNSYLGYYWASFGYVVIMPQHIGSDKDIFIHRYRNEEQYSDDFSINGTEELFISNRLNRPKDVTFVVDMLEGDQINPQKLAKICNFDKIGMSGHSYGAFSTLAISGALIDFPDEENKSFRDKRFIAAIAMSPHYLDSNRPKFDLKTGGTPKNDNKKNEGFGFNAGAWEKVDIPIFLMYGELEAPEWRYNVFKSVASKEKYNMPIKNATHMAFSDSALGSRYRDKNHHKYIQLTTLKFWDAYLKDDADAKKFLTDNEISKISKNQCNIESSIEK